MSQKENLSAYMDGYEQDKDFADVITSSPELTQKWADYHKIRSVMRDEPLILGEDFSQKMAALIDQEAPLGKPVKSAKVLKLKRWTSPLWQGAIAASVCLMTVLGYQHFQQSQENVAQNSEPVLMTIPFSNAVQAVSYNAPVQMQPTQERLESQQRLLNSLLQNHELQRRSQNSKVILSEEEKAKSQTSGKAPNAQ